MYPKLNTFKFIYLNISSTNAVEQSNEKEEDKSYGSICNAAVVFIQRLLYPHKPC